MNGLVKVCFYREAELICVRGVAGRDSIISSDLGHNSQDD